MAEGNTSSKQQPTSNANNSVQQNGQEATTNSAKKSSRSASKGTNKMRVGGTAVQGSKSTQPKQTPATSDPNEQQLASYNRTMRRRVEKMGTNNTDRRTQNVQEQRRKRIERRKQRLEERRATIRKSMPGGGKITLGRRNTFFIIGVILLLVIVIAVFVLIRLHIIG